MTPLCSTLKCEENKETHTSLSSYVAVLGRKTFD